MTRRKTTGLGVLPGVAALVLAALPCVARAAEPGPITDRQREALKLDRFYQKQTDAGGLLVVGSAKVSDNALAEAAWIVSRMLGGRKDILKAMKDNRVRVAVMAATEYTTDVPEHSRLNPKLYWDRRARGLGATLANPVVSCGEENLLGYPGDPYPKENIFVHEFAHAIHGTGLRKTDPTFDRRLRAAYKAAMDRGLWKNTYAATNHSEYWAEGVQSWFDDNAPPGALHNKIRTRALLKDYDPALAKLCQEVFGDGPWRYLRPAARKPQDRLHLTGYDPKKLPCFQWRKVPPGAKSRVTVQTALGDFEIEVDARSAPEAARVFLETARQGGYHSGQFRRAARPARESATGSVEAATNPQWRKESARQLKLPDAATPPNAWSVALAARGENVGGFIVFVGEPHGKNVDLVPFGRVLKGQEVVRKILASPTDTDIRRVIRIE